MSSDQRDRKLSNQMDMLREQRRGLMIVLSSPSGAGKTTLTRRLLAENMSTMSMSVSATTRKPRPGEEEGTDYYFVSKSKFTDMIDAGEFLESAKVFDNYYGTPRGPVEAALMDGKDIVFDIDWQGAQQLTQAAGEDLVKIFILPPNMHTLEQRLKSRAQDSDLVIAKRMAKSESEISHWAEYDYVIVNDQIDQALAELRIIVAAERHKRRRQLWLSPFVKTLIDGG